MRRISALPVNTPMHCGFVYLAAGHPNGWIKIGRTTDLHQRFYCMSRTMGFPVRPFWVVKVEDAEEVERLLHEIFAAKRPTRKEWFMLTAEDVEFIKREVGQHAEEVIEDLSDLRKIPSYWWLVKFPMGSPRWKKHRKAKGQ